MAADIKIFNRWSTEAVEVEDEGLKAYISLEPVMFPKTGGRHARKQFHKSRLNIVERLIGKLFVAGHRGKKHKFTSGRNVGHTYTAMRTVEDAFSIIEKKTGRNPVEVLVRAIEKTAPIEEAISYQRGGSFAREAVVTSPQRRVDLALRHITQGTFASSRTSRKTAGQALAEQIMLAYKEDSGCLAVSEKVRREREALGAR